MFGTAVYLGSFWKAYRFATLTQDYQDRPGAVIRVLAFWKRTVIRNFQSPHCYCAACCGKPTFADHQETWKQPTVDVLVMLPQESQGKFIVRNKEYACRDDSLLVLDAVCTATRTARMSHDPWDRSMVVE